MHLVTKYKYYTIQEKNGKTQFGIQNNEIPDAYIEKIVSTYNNHIIPKLTQRDILESVIFCIGSAGTTYERPTKFIKNLKDYSTSHLLDDEFLSFQAKHGPATLKNAVPDLFTSAIEFVHGNGGAEVFAQEFLSHPFEMREELVDYVKWVRHKTASFIYLTLGGDKPLLTYDRHVARQFANLGIYLDDKYTIGKIGKNGKKYRDTLANKQYLLKEAESLHLIQQTDLQEKFPIFTNKDGSIHGGLLTTLLWNIGTEISRYMSPNQIKLFNHTDFLSPYSNIE